MLIKNSVTSILRLILGTALLITATPTDVFADCMIYSDEDVTIQTPFDTCTPCPDKIGLTHKTCASQGDVLLFVTKTPDIYASSRDLLQRHLDESKQAIQSNTNIHVSKAEIINDTPPMGRIDTEIPSFSNEFFGNTPYIHQTSVVIPTTGILYQLFILSPEEVDAEFIGYITSHSKVTENHISVPSILSMLPKSIMMGAIGALMVILLMRLIKHLKKVNNGHPNIE